MGDSGGDEGPSSQTFDADGDDAVRYARGDAIPDDHIGNTRDRPGIAVGREMGITASENAGGVENREASAFQFQGVSMFRE
jgi:hypothetical protein